MIETDSAGFPTRVEDLDADWLLALVEDAEDQSRKAERRKLRLAHQWCVINPATTQTGPATWAETRDAAECHEAIGGDGCPLVAAWAAEQLGTALRLSTDTALQLMADALNLHHRLPRIWAQVESLAVPAWRARRVAQATAHLSAPAAAHVDRQLVTKIGSCGKVTIDRAIEEAKARYEPDEVADNEAKARATWGVELRHRPADHPGGGWAATSWLTATGDTLDLTRFHDLVCATAARLKTDGDPDDLNLRKAKAIGIITDLAQGITPTTTPATTPALTGHHPGPDRQDPGLRPPHRRRPPPPRPRHRRGTRPRDHGRHRRTTRPGHPGQDQGLARRRRPRHHPPRPRPVPHRRRRPATTHPSGCATWSSCATSTACSPGAPRTPATATSTTSSPTTNDGPPGQTHPENLAPLCRRHHNCKTAGLWRYYRHPDGTYTWHSPTGRTYTVTRSGTITHG